MKLVSNCFRIGTSFAHLSERCDCQVAFCQARRIETPIPSGFTLRQMGGIIRHLRPEPRSPCAEMGVRGDRQLAEHSQLARAHFLDSPSPSQGSGRWSLLRVSSPSWEVTT
jgi:hypothetical protein